MGEVTQKAMTYNTVISYLRVIADEGWIDTVDFDEIANHFVQKPRLNNLMQFCF